MKEYMKTQFLLGTCALAACFVGCQNDEYLMEQIAEKLGTTVSHEDAVSFGAFSSRSFDPAFIGAVAGAELNKIEGPVVGNVGVYMFNVTDRETGAFYTEDDAQRRNMQSAQYQMRMLPSVWTDQAGVKDTRAKFF